MVDFLIKYYILFLIIALIAIFAFIGYFVDQNDQKKGISKINKIEDEKDIRDLATSAQNKTLNSAVQDFAVGQASLQNSFYSQSNQNQINQQNIITDTTTTLQSSQESNIGFNVVKK